VSPTTLRTLERIRAISPTDAEIFARALQQGATGVNFTTDLIALNQALQLVAANTSLQVYRLGFIGGSPVWGSLRTGVGIVDFAGVTLVVVMRGGQLVQTLGPLR
jgi:hypothetical protein